MNCLHPIIELDYVPQASNDTNVLVLSIRAQCSVCGPLRFIGVDEGISLRRPSTSTDGCVVHMPIIPNFEEVEHERRMDA